MDIHARLERARNLSSGRREARMGANAGCVLGTYASYRSNSHTRWYAFYTEQNTFSRKQEEGTARRTARAHCAGCHPRWPIHWGNSKKRLALSKRFKEGVRRPKVVCVLIQGFLSFQLSYVNWILFFPSTRLVFGAGVLRCRKCRIYCSQHCSLLCLIKFYVFC